MPDVAIGGKQTVIFGQASPKLSVHVFFSLRVSFAYCMDPYVLGHIGPEIASQPHPSHTASGLGAAPAATAAPTAPTAPKAIHQAPNYPCRPRHHQPAWSWRKLEKLPPHPQLFISQLLLARLPHLPAPLWSPQSSGLRLWSPVIACLLVFAVCSSHQRLNPHQLHRLRIASRALVLSLDHEPSPCSATLTKTAVLFIAAHGSCLSPSLVLVFGLGFPNNHRRFMPDDVLMHTE